MLRIVLGLLLAFPGLTRAVDEVFSTSEGAIRGYDAVAYHREGKPVLGSAEIVHEWNGASWRFSSAVNRDAFAAEPERFAPQYGGFCAYGTSQGYKVSTQPEAFAIVEGKLYLNYSNPVQVTWNKDQPGYIGLADAHWKKLEHEAYTSGQ